MGARPVLYLLRMERRLRIAAVALVLAWFFVPLLRDSIPAWIPFLAFAALEAQFLVSGLRERGAPRGKRGRAPLPEDVEEFGGPEWLEPVLVEAEGHQVWVPADIERGPRVVRPRRNLLPRLEGVARARGAASVLLVLLPEGGWRGLDSGRPAEDRGAALGRGGDGSPATRRTSTATARARRSGSSSTPTASPRSAAERLPDAGDLLPALPARVQGRRGRVQPDRAGDRRARPRGVAPPRRDRRGSHELLRASRAASRSAGGWVCRTGTAARMMRQQLADNPIHAASAPEYLVPRECRNGGRPRSRARQQSVSLTARSSSAPTSTSTPRRA